MTHEEQKYTLVSPLLPQFFFPFLPSQPMFQHWILLSPSPHLIKLTQNTKKHSQTLLIKYAEISLKAHMFHQFVKPNMIIPNACNLFVAIGDHWGVNLMPFLPNNVMLVL
jgi:hypothetical protein